MHSLVLKVVHQIFLSLVQWRCLKRHNIVSVLQKLKLQRSKFVILKYSTLY